MLKTSALHRGVMLYSKLDFQVCRQSIRYQTKVFQGPASCASQVCLLHIGERSEYAPSSSHTYYMNYLGRVPQPTQRVPSLGHQELGCRAHPKVQLLLSVKVALNRSVIRGFRKHGWLYIGWVKYCEDYQLTLLFPP